MRAINGGEAGRLVEERRGTQGRNLTDFTSARKRWRGYLDGEKADRNLRRRLKASVYLVWNACLIRQRWRCRVSTSRSTSSHNRQYQRRRTSVS
jgi:hypothetical protein